MQVAQGDHDILSVLSIMGNNIYIRMATPVDDEYLAKHTEMPPDAGIVHILCYYKRP